jgi:hypothetical protein
MVSNFCLKISASTRPSAQHKNGSTDRVGSSAAADYAVNAIRSEFLCGMMLKRRSWITLTMIHLAVTLAGCAATEPAPVPVPVPSAFDRSWSAAVSAAQDEGVLITSEDRGSGVIRGVRNDQEVTLNLRSQADGSVRIEIGARGPKGAEPGLAGRISRAYDRRMGR